MKKFKKVLAKNTYAVIVTILMCIGIFFYIQKVFESKTNSINEKNELVLKDRITFEIEKIRGKDSLARFAEALAIKEQELIKLKIEIDQTLKRLQLKEEKIDDIDKLNSLIDHLRTGFGSIEPGVQIIDKEDYMKLYREHEATNILAQAYAKKLGVFNEYEEFFKNRQGIWNIIMTDSR